jgi:hypothetical protein
MAIDRLTYKLASIAVPHSLSPLFRHQDANTDEVIEDSQSVS